MVLVGSAMVACGGSVASDTSAPPPVGGDPTAPAPSVATSITLDRQSATFSSLGATQSIAAEVRDQRGQLMSSAPIAWSSSNSGIATVSTAGVIAAVASGSASITATAGSASATVVVTVSQIVTSISIVPATVTIAGIGATQPLTATARDANGNTVPLVSVTWSITPASIASISSTGVVTSVASGQAMVTASYQSVVATAQVDVQGGNNPQSCTSRTPFSNFLIDPSLLKVVTQIGVVGGANTSLVGRSYAFAVDGDGVRLPLTAPTDMQIVAARHYAPPGSPTVGYVPDWSLLLDVGCGVKMELYHIKDVASSLKVVVDTTVYNSSAWQPMAQPVSFRAGETFGWYMRGLNSVAFDVIAHDDSKHNQFTNQARYEAGGNLLDIVCPWSLFAPAKRDAYMAIMGAPTGQRVPNGGCGTVERDVAGTPAGQWFLSTNVADSWVLSKNGNYGNPLPIILGIDSTVYVGHIGPSDDVRIDRSNASWKNPASITTSWCYQARNGSSDAGWLWLRMNTITHMDVAYDSVGSCPAVFPSSGSAAYYR